MSWWEKLFFWKKTTPAVAPHVTADVPTLPTPVQPSTDTPVRELTEEEQQAEQIKNFIRSDDISNHQLAAMFLQSLELEWDEELYTLIGKSAEKMSFWATQELPHFIAYYQELVIDTRFFSQYSEIAEFAAILPNFSALQVLRWEAGPYWNQHPILSAASQLPQLKSLYAENCKMHYLPDELCQSKSLQYLHLKNNKLSELPQSLEGLRNLKFLDLSHNQFQKCPRHLSVLKQLATLYLNDNPMLDLEPRLLGRLYKLTDLSLPIDLAKFYYDILRSWLPDVDFDKPYWDFED